MHKNGKFIPLLALGFTFFLSGCDYFADKHLVEELKKQQKEQETKINLLEKQQTTIINTTQKVAEVVGALNANNGYSTTQNWIHHKRAILLLTTAISD